MKSIPKEEWLDQAKRLHVGSSRRVYHGAEGKPNLLISNKHDKYTCWCFRCNKGGVRMKEQVALTKAPPVAQERAVMSSNPGPLVPVLSLPPDRLREVLVHLNEKGMSLELLAEMNPLYSQKDSRLVLTTPDVLIGRDTTGKHPAKWHTYIDATGFSRGAFREFTGTVVLVEDMYSAVKINQACPDVLAVACLGTKVGIQLTSRLMVAQHVVLWFDSDAAGQDARAKTLRLFSLLDFRYSHITTAQDPKQLSIKQIQDELYEYRQEYPSSTESER